ncbi:Protein of unknown function [Paramicrobacterium humi]|uniref:DUF3097 domain-containing protein n=1 Tax=Paramicrobacterium humi TaxID=640635 RepID=A0A1H4PAH7_9MICO|nr:DUF3097 domain-containing protein [Microbacterium humi]SEC04345.1 Protein of unknown function [Microbacterium humi]
MNDRYGTDVLAGDWRNKGRPVVAKVEAVRDLVVEDAGSGWCGAVVRLEGQIVELEDYFGKVRAFPLGPGFLVEGKPVELVRPRSPQEQSRVRTASGSFASGQERARVARQSRIYVEGRHDAELVEKVWGDDLRAEGVVVEYLGGIDDLDTIIRDAAPTRAARIGVLVDHLVPGSKESRIAERVQASPHGQNVLIVGHPFIDIWQAVLPERLGISAWPSVPRNIEWKRGICRSFGWPSDDQADIARAWKRILSRVSRYTDLEPELLGRVEQLIDFVTEPD